MRDEKPFKFKGKVENLRLTGKACISEYAAVGIKHGTHDSFDVKYTKEKFRKQKVVVSNAWCTRFTISI